MKPVGIVILALIVGCAGPSAAPDPTPTNEDAGPSMATFPAAFDTPATVLSGGASSFSGAAGEPNVVVAPDGTRYVGVLGCPEGQSLGLEDTAACRHGLVYRSSDGIAWEMLNQGDDRRLGDGPFANGDTTVAVTQQALHVLLLGSGTIHHHRSSDGGDTWTYVGPLTESADRPWLATSPDGRLLATWRSGERVTVRISDDDGDTWDAGKLDARVFRQGVVVWGPACSCFLMPLMVYLDQADFSDPDVTNVGVEVFRSDDGVTWAGSGPLASFPVGISGALTADTTFTFPAVGQSQGGLTAVAWSLGVGPEPGVRTAARLFLSTGHNATDWTVPEDVTPEQSAVLPALAGGRDLVLAYYSSPVPGDPERVGVWSLTAQFLHGGERVVVESDVHHGGVCGRGGFCNGIGADRSLFDFFEATALPDGRVALAYTVDPADEAKAVQVHYAEQLRA